MSEGISPHGIIGTFASGVDFATLCIYWSGKRIRKPATAMVASLVGQQTARLLLRKLRHATMNR